MQQDTTEYSDEALIEEINHLARYGSVVHEYDNETHVLKNKDFRIEIVKNNKWLGLDFHLLDSEGATSLNFSIDTDLYNVSLDKHKELLNDTGMDILSFLSALSNKRVLIGKYKKRDTMVFPLSDYYVQILKQRFWTTRLELKFLNDARSDDKLTPLSIEE